MNQMMVDDLCRRRLESLTHFGMLAVTTRMVERLHALLDGQVGFGRFQVAPGERSPVITETAHALQIGRDFFLNPDASDRGSPRDRAWRFKEKSSSKSTNQNATLREAEAGLGRGMWMYLDAISGFGGPLFEASCRGAITHVVMGASLPTGDDVGNYFCQQFEFDVNQAPREARRGISLTLRRSKREEAARGNPVSPSDFGSLWR